MEPAFQLLVVAVLATAEFCAEPIAGGVEEPTFCRVQNSMDLSTPYFSITVEPDFLVGVDRQGRRLMIQTTVSQNQDHLTIEVQDRVDPVTWASCPELQEWVEDGVKWQDCRISIEGTYQRHLMASMPGRVVVIEYGYSSPGAVFGPALESMTQSVRVHAI